jgi:regulator of RNase E activity RraB
MTDQQDIGPITFGQGGDSDEAWELYARDIEGKPAFVNLNSMAIAQGPDPRRPVLIMIKLAPKGVKPSGGDHDDELSDDQLAAVKRVAGHAKNWLAKTAQANIVAWMLHGGVVTIYAYADKPGATAATDAKRVEVLQGVLGEIRATVSAKGDGDWQHLEEHVLPTAEEVRYSADMSVLGQLEDAGDDMVSPREIEHCAVFDDPSDQKRFATLIEKNGFRVTEVSEEDDETGEMTVLFTSRCVPNIDQILEQTTKADQLAEDCNGLYDGWGCEVVPKG